MANKTNFNMKRGIIGSIIGAIIGAAVFFILGLLIF